jgi:hypothetical protein
VTFTLVVLINLAKHAPEELGIDARIYVRAAEAFLSGQSAWDAYATNWRGDVGHFAALPTTVLAFVPFTALEERLTVWIWVVASGLAAVFIVRKLGLAWWWVLFPPLAHGVFVSNPQVVLLALLLSGSSLLEGLAPMLKVYALAPLLAERHVKSLAIAALLTALSILLAPGLWGNYLSRAGEITARLYFEAEGGHSAFVYGPGLAAAVALGIVALAIVDMRAAGWLVAPALVPASQFHLATMTMPVLAAQGPVLMVLLLTVPIPGITGVVAAAWGFWRLGAKTLKRPRAASASP